jgi:fucose 4-O-acetylase-like acetyltransferase
MKQRDYYFDNVKFILILFVVFGHLLWSYNENNHLISTVYKEIYTFHMPAFILVSGYFSKGFNKKGYIPKIAKKLILPYLIFQVIYSIFYYFQHHKSTFEVNPFDPHWSLWFLISLFFWNILLIIFTKLKAPVSISIALTVGMLIGYVDWASDFLSLLRTFVFFPLFLIGYYLKKEHIYMLLQQKIKILSLAMILIVFAGLYFLPGIQEDWLLGSKPYDKLGAAASGIAMLKRLGIYLLNFAMVLSFLAMIPQKRYFFTNLGKNTLYVYLLHGFFVRVFRDSNLQDYFSPTTGFLLLAGLALGLTLLLSSKVITSITQPFIELKMSKTKRFVYRMVDTFRI